MVKARKGIPQKLRASVLKEFNHRCAICGKDNPQLHHIDEDPSNNVAANLIPLCPNHHLIDQHNPSAKFDPEKLALFRAYRDPAILSPQFEPLFKRMKFLGHIQEKQSVESLESAGDELASFIYSLEMGGFYGGRALRLLEVPPRGRVTVLGQEPDPRQLKEDRLFEQEYRNQLRSARAQIEELVVELLRYQNWLPRES